MEPNEPAPPVTVFAVEDDAVQLAWPGLPARAGALGVGDRSVEVEASPPAWLFRRWGRPRRLDANPGGPGAVVVDGLAPATTYELWWQPDGGGRRVLGQVTTLAPPPGRLLTRFATISDLHVGERRFGALGGIRDVAPPSARQESYSRRATAAALEEAAAWGATTMVVKGDLTARCRPEQFRAVADLLAAAPMTALIQLGNHDVVRPVDLDVVLPGTTVAAGGQPVVHDLPGIRLVLGDSAIPGHRSGRVGRAQAEQLAAAAASAPAGAGVAVSLHHPPRRWPVPVSYPPGVVYRDSRHLLAALAEANPATVVVAGHSHRNRAYRIRGLPVAEVGSTKDYPGAWAGYAVHEGGIRQVVRRTARPDVLAWTEATSRAIAGVWGLWSPGRLTDRCWSWTWPER